MNINIIYWYIGVNWYIISLFDFISTSRIAFKFITHQNRF